MLNTHNFWSVEISEICRCLSENFIFLFPNVATMPSVYEDIFDSVGIHATLWGWRKPVR